MNFDGVLFQKVANVITPIVTGATMNKIELISNHTFCLSLYKEKKGFCFYISLQSNTAHFTLSDKRPDQILAPTSFCDMLRQHLAGGQIREIILISGDRILQLVIEKENEVGIRYQRHLYIELTGKRTNLILTKEDHIILDALFKYSFDEGSMRMVARGILYQFPQKKMQTRFSTLLAKEQSFRQIDESELLNLVEVSDTVYLYSDVFHLIPLLHRQETPVVSPILTGIYSFYEKRRKEETDNELIRPVQKILTQELKRLEKRRALLEDSKISANRAWEVKYWADLLFTYATDLTKKQKELCVYDEEKQQDVTIPLDDRYDIKTNARHLYQTYKKRLASLQHIEDQTAKCLDEMFYYQTIESQLQNDLTYEEIQQIHQELITKKINKQKQPIRKTKSLKPKITYTTYISPEGPSIYVGKNNLQNDYLTFKLAQPEDMFFHVKDMPGSHVIVRGQPLGEVTIRLAAKIAAYYSKARYSASIPVNYTKVMNIKKVSGGPLGKVILAKNRTIFIDIDEDLEVYRSPKS